MNTVVEPHIRPETGNMPILAKIFQYEFSDVIRGKGIIGYAVFFFAITEVLIRFSGGAKALLSLMNVILIITPLVCILFGSIYLYNARNFVEMLLVQPVKRAQMFWGLFLELSGVQCHLIPMVLKPLKAMQNNLHEIMNFHLLSLLGLTQML